MFIPDFMIQKLCENGFHRTWTPSGGPNAGTEMVIENAGPLISDFDPKHLGVMSYDLQVGLSFASPRPLLAHVVRDGERVRSIGSLGEIDGLREIRHAQEVIEVILEPGQAVLCHSAEYVRIPPQLVGQLAMRSSFAREWLDHSAADVIMPGFQGQITFELRNHGDNPYVLRSGMRPVQLMFASMLQIPSRPYKGLYQWQERQLYSRMKREGDK